MATTALKRSIKIHALAGDLGIKASADPVREIVRFCEKRIRRFLRDFPDCATLSELLEIAGSKLGTRFEEIHSDEDLEEVRARYLRQGEKAFAELHEELSPQIFGVTFRRTNKKAWELQFVSVIEREALPLVLHKVARTWASSDPDRSDAPHIQANSFRTRG
jgi:hypothetical protein